MLSRTASGGLDRFGRVIDNKWTNYSSSTTLDQLKYTYDRASNRTSRENVVAKAQTTPKYFDELYGYDGSNRLSLMERGQLAGTPPSSVTNKQFAQDWGLDPTGNWKVFKEDDNGNGTWELNQTRTSNSVNEITAINETAGPAWVTPGYDSAGNMTTIPRPAEPTGDFTGVYDAWNRLVELRGLADTVVARYEYDGLTRRVVKHTFPGWEELESADWTAMTAEDWNGLQLTQAHQRDYYYSVGWRILEERVEDNTVFDRQYVWGLRYIDGLVFRDRQLTSSVQRTYALQDANWNVTALADSNGSVVERYSYTAYGVPTFLNPDFTTAANNEAYDWDVLYAGYKWDSASALYQVRFRYLQPALGTWLSRDLSFYDGPHLIQYVKSLPIGLTDPTGRVAMSDLEKKDLKRMTCEIKFMKDFANVQDYLDKNPSVYGANACIDGELKVYLRGRDTKDKIADECGLRECTELHEKHHQDQAQLICKDKLDCKNKQGCNILAFGRLKNDPNFAECYANTHELLCVAAKYMKAKNNKMADPCKNKYLDSMSNLLFVLTKSNYLCGIVDPNNFSVTLDRKYINNEKLFTDVQKDIQEYEENALNPNK